MWDCAIWLVKIDKNHLNEFILEIMTSFRSNHRVWKIHIEIVEGLLLELVRIYFSRIEQAMKYSFHLFSCLQNFIFHLCMIYNVHTHARTYIIQYPHRHTFWGRNLHWSRSVKLCFISNLNVLDSRMEPICNSINKLHDLSWFYDMEQIMIFS